MSMLQSVLTGFLSLLIGSGFAFFVSIVIHIPHYRKGLKKVGKHPGFRSVVSPFNAIGYGLGRIPGVYAGFDMPWVGKHRVFDEFGSDVFSAVTYYGKAIIYVADADLIQKINGNTSAYPKPTSEYTVLNFLGPNLVTASGTDWRRQLTISKGVFNHKGWIFLWDETHGIFDNMMVSTGWDKMQPGEEIMIEHVVSEITLRVALLAIANAGFGMRMKWKDDTEKPAPGHTMSFQEALHIVAQSSVTKMGMPKLAFHLPIAKLRKIRQAFDELAQYIQEMIKDRKSHILGEKVAQSPDLSSDSPRMGFPKEDRADLFHNLVKASLEGAESLTDEELQGNIYIYLLAGHETTAHSIAFTFALLALYPEVQEKLYQHIMRAMPKDGQTTYDDYELFDYVLAVYYETLRMFPPVQQIPKMLAQDTMLVFDESNAQNAEIGLAVQAEVQDREKRLGEKRLDADALYVTPPISPCRPSTFIHSTSTPSPATSTTSTPSPSGTSLSTSTSTSSLSTSASTDEPTVTASSTATSIAPSVTVEDHDEPKTAEEVDRNLPGSFSPLTETEAPRRPLPPKRLPSKCKPVTHQGGHPTALPGQKSLLVEEGTVVFVSPPGVHYNPKYYPDPYKFKPERFMGSYDPTTFIPFSTGTRVCLGRHFSEVESVCFIAYMMKEFSVHPKPAFEGETRDQMKERMFEAVPVITLTPKSIPLIFKKR